MKILGIGEIVIDKTYILENDITLGQKQQSSNTSLSIGGPVPVALKILKNLGAEVTMLSCVGKDPLSEYIKEEFDLAGIKHCLLTGCQTKLNTIIVDKNSGDRTIIKDTHINKLIKQIDISLIKEADAIIFDRTEPLAFDFVLKHKNPNTIILVDPSSELSEKTIHMMKNSNASIFPKDVLKNLNCTNIKSGITKLYEILSKEIILTDGCNGTYIYDGNTFSHIEACKINAIDTNGAGDIYRGAFLWGLLQKWNNANSIEFASKISALHCLKIGNLHAVPNLEEITKNKIFA